MTVAVLNGAQKAAMVVLALREEVAVDLLRLLSDEDLRVLTKAAESLDPIPGGQLVPVLRQFEDALENPLILPPGARYLHKLAYSALGKEKASQLLRAARPTPAAKLADNNVLTAVKPETLAELLKREHPQIAAALLTQLPPERAADVLCQFDEEQQLDLITRTSQLKELPKDVLEKVSDSFLGPLSSAKSIHTGDVTEPFDGVKYVATLVNSLPADDCDRILEALEELDETIATSLREAMFTFEDLARLDNASLQTLLREISSEQLLIGLRSAGESIRAAFFGAVSKRAAAAMREELEFMAPKRLSEVEAAQREVVEAAMKLATDGRIEKLGAKEDDMV